MAHSLIEAFPQPEDLLAAQPEELAGVLIEALPLLMQPAGFQFVDIEQIFYPPHGTGYPRMTNGEVNLAISEALAWLEQQGLLIRNPNQPNPNWYMLTRRGREIKTRGALEAYRLGRQLPVDLLQPEISEKVHHLFLRGDYDTAVFQAYKIVEMQVRQSCNFPADWPAHRVMRSAFSVEKSGPLTDKDLPNSEQQAISDLFAGAMGHARNPPSHRDVNLHRTDAIRLILFAGYLLDIVKIRYLLS